MTYTDSGSRHPRAPTARSLAVSGASSVRDAIAFQAFGLTLCATGEYGTTSDQFAHGACAQQHAPGTRARKRSADVQAGALAGLEAAHRWTLSLDRQRDLLSSPGGAGADSRAAPATLGVANGEQSRTDFHWRTADPPACRRLAKTSSSARPISPYTSTSPLLLPSFTTVSSSRYVSARRSMACNTCRAGSSARGKRPNNTSAFTCARATRTAFRCHRERPPAALPVYCYARRRSAANHDYPPAAAPFQGH